MGGIDVIDFLLTLNWSQIIVATIVTFGGAMGVWYRNKMKAWAAAWSRAFDGLQAIPRLQEDIQGIKYFVTPNGGGSLMDSARRMEEALAALASRVELLAETAVAENDTDESLARFRCSTTGENVYVSQTYARWLGVGKSDIMGWNFLNTIHPDDAARVQSHWAQCRAENRQYRTTYRAITSAGDVITLAVTCTPIPEGGATRCWIGYARKVEHDADHAAVPR